MQSAQNITGIPALDAVLPTLRALGPSGFIFAHDISFWGPQYFYTEYPRAWQREYESGHYDHFDPTLLWAMTHTGAIRWSEVRLPDLRGVMKAALRYGMAYGGCFSCAAKGTRSILSLARDDREFTDEEMAFLAATAEALLSEVLRDGGSGAISPAEAETLRCLRDGMSHAEASELLNVSVPTIKARVEKARGKLGARNATQAVALALRRKLI